VSQSFHTQSAFPATACGPFAVNTNRPPVVLANSSYTVQQGSGPLVVGAPGPLSNVTDPDGDALYMFLYSPPTFGRVVYNANGSFVYTPSPGFIGLVTFTFSVRDTRGGWALGTVTINVTGALRCASGRLHVYLGTPSRWLMSAPFAVPPRLRAGSPPRRLEAKLLCHTCSGGGGVDGTKRSPPVHFIPCWQKFDPI
jgi:hypothetical protein